jgi:hypothetical protein
MRLSVYVRSLLTATLIAATTMPALAETADGVNARIDNLLGNHALYETTINAFQQAVAAGTKEDVAAFVRYPIMVAISGRKTAIRSADDFIKNYDAIMTTAITDAIKAQKYEDLFVNDQGVMFGRGQAWVDGICLDRKCKTSVVKVITLQDAPAP